MYPLCSLTGSTSADLRDFLHLILKTMFARFYAIPNFLIATACHRLLSSLAKWLPENIILQELVFYKLEFCMTREWPDIHDISVRIRFSLSGMPFSLLLEGKPLLHALGIHIMVKKPDDYIPYTL
jgi:hypothetical protein